MKVSGRIALRKGLAVSNIQMDKFIRESSRMTCLMGMERRFRLMDLGTLDNSVQENTTDKANTEEPT